MHVWTGLIVSLGLAVHAGQALAGAEEATSGSAPVPPTEAVMSTSADRDQPARSAGFDLVLDTSLRLRFDPELGSYESVNRSVSEAAMATAPTRRKELHRFRATLDLDIDPISLGALQDAGPPTDGIADGNDSLAERATNPVASLLQFQFQNTSTFESNAGSGYSNAFVIQPILPWTLGDQNVLSRLTLPLVATPDLGDPIGREYGLGDFVALNAFSFRIDEGPWQGIVAPIATFTFPTASSDFTGEGKFQAGPGFGYINTATDGLQWGVFGYQQWSYASAGGDGGRPEVSKFFFQPILTMHFDDGWYAGLGDFLWSYDWNSEKWSLPLGVRVGRVMNIGDQSVNLFVEPFYDLSGNNPGGEWGLKLNLTLLFPQ